MAQFDHFSNLAPEPERRPAVNSKLRHHRIKSLLRDVIETPSCPANHTFNLVMNLLVYLVVILSVLETALDPDPLVKSSMVGMSYAIMSLFLVEFVIRWWISSDLIVDYQDALLRFERRFHNKTVWMRHYFALRNVVGRKLAWLGRPGNIADLIAVLPLFPGLWQLRFLVLLKLFRYCPRLTFFGSIIRQRSSELSALGVVAIILLGITALGFYLAEHGVNPKVNSPWDAIYWVMITAATVGYGDIAPVTHMGRFLAIAGLAVGLGITAFMASIITSVMTERLFTLREHRMDRIIEHFQGHIVVCGLGTLGRAVCRTLRHEGKTFTGVDTDTTRVDAAIREGWPSIQGDVTEETTWERLGLEKARAVIIAIPDESVNAITILFVREKNSECFIVACGTTPPSEKRLLKVGANRVVSPAQSGGTQMVNATLRPSALTLFNLALERDQIELEMEELSIPTGSVFEGMTLRESNIRQDFNVIVVGIVPPSGRIIFNPTATTKIGRGDTMVCMGHLDDIERLKRALRDRV